MKVYVASSWKNQRQPGVVGSLREWGHDVYDFRHPAPGDDGFSWREIDDGFDSWTPKQYRAALRSAPAVRGFRLDMDALRWCDACLLVLPCGKSAHWELGWAMGAGKEGAIYMPERDTPELMYSDAEILVSPFELHDWAGRVRGGGR